MKKIVLDVTCGSRMFWFDKRNPITFFVDKRKENHILCDGRKLEINPDKIMDFRKLRFQRNKFNLVVFDPPHLKQLGKNSWMAKKYGILSENWQSDIRQGFSECFRVLKKYGVLVFKWNERDISVTEILKLSSIPPLFGHTTGRSGKTKWICFMKI